MSKAKLKRRRKARRRRGNMQRRVTMKEFQQAQAKIIELSELVMALRKENEALIAERGYAEKILRIAA